MNRVEWLNEVVVECDGFIILEPFRQDEDCFRGSIQMNASTKESILLDVEIPISYPLLDLGKKCCRFISKNVTGYKHINEDNTICLDIPKCTDFEERFRMELAGLKEWRDTYYLANTEDERYEYPIVPTQNGLSFLFTDVQRIFKKEDSGQVKGVVLADKSKIFNTPIFTTYLTQIGDVRIPWSLQLRRGNEDKCLGLYYFMEVEPIEKGNIICKSWKVLEKYISHSFREKLFKELKNPKSTLNFLFLGYRIRQTDEIHWLGLKIDKNQGFIKALPYARNCFHYYFQDIRIEWCKTQNASYERFFGRGAVSQYLKSKKILILGVGAIGSSVAKILTRSGILNLTLHDFDSVEIGNICRAEFNLEELQLPKMVAVLMDLYKISPFVNVDLIEFKDSKRLDVPYRGRTLDILNKFDIIFNCTSDDELIYILDELKPNSQIINLSITDKAKELMCFVGNNVREQLESFITPLSSTPHVFYEGTGCWSSTFEASFFDINAMVHLSIKNINSRFEKQQDLRSFIVKTVNQNGYENLIINGI